jgi:tRNA threonylcarbamoyladenosine modification (KEOPS) complex  Pcc1 subunit
MRRATITTDHDDRETAEYVARAVTPDNTAEMTTQVDDDAVVTTIERESTSGLHATIDDYVVNLTVAAQLADHPTTNDT